MSTGRDQVETYMLALAHPLRRAVLRTLLRRDASPKEMADLFDARLGNVSYHVRKLAELGLIRVVREELRRGAVEHWYTVIDRGLVEAALAVFDGLRDRLEASADDDVTVRLTDTNDGRVRATFLPTHPIGPVCPVCGEVAVLGGAQQITTERVGELHPTAKQGVVAYRCANGHWHDGKQETGPVPDDVTVLLGPREAR